MEQFLVPLKSPSLVRKAAPAAAEIDNWPRSRSGRCNAYVFAFAQDEVDGRRQVAARFFIKAPGSGVFEDPGTGSACANLGDAKVRVGGRVVEVASGTVCLPD